MCLFDQTGLQKQELATGSKLRSAIEEARGLCLRQRRHHLQLINSNPDYLSAVNPNARITWGKLVCQELSEHFHLGRHKPEPDQPIFLVTLCDLRCCTSHQERDVDIPRFIRILRRGLRGLSYLGMIEPAYYVNVCPGTHVHGKRMVSWHLHLIAWGECHKTLRKRVDRLNDKRVLLPIADGLAAAHQKRISKGKVADKIAYVLKAPKKAYRLFKRKFMTIDGEVISKFKQKKSDFRPGERVTVFPTDGYWKMPLRWAKNANANGHRPKVFTASLGDWLDNKVPRSWRADLAQLIHDTPNLDWLMLTKRIENFDKLAPWRRHDVPSHVWIGVTCENQEWFDRRYKHLDDIDAIRFISYEPALGPLKIAAARPDWVICGGESGPGARPMKPKWARRLRDECADLGIAFFLKQIGSDHSRWPADIRGKGDDMGEWPKDLRIRQFPVVRGL